MLKSLKTIFSRGKAYNIPVERSQSLRKKEEKAKAKAKAKSAYNAADELLKILEKPLNPEERLLKGIGLGETKPPCNLCKGTSYYMAMSHLGAQKEHCPHCSDHVWREPAKSQDTSFDNLLPSKPKTLSEAVEEQRAARELKIKQVKIESSAAEAKYAHLLNPAPSVGYYSVTYKEGCDRCDGTGYIRMYNHIENGICFKCRGRSRYS